MWFSVRCETEFLKYLLLKLGFKTKHYLKPLLLTVCVTSKISNTTCVQNYYYLFSKQYSKAYKMFQLLQLELMFSQTALADMTSVVFFSIILNVLKFIHVYPVSIHH